MAVFLAGVLVTLVPGLVTGWVVGGLVGWVMRRDDCCRHPRPGPVMVPLVPSVIAVCVRPDTGFSPGWPAVRLVEGRVLPPLSGSGYPVIG